MTAITRSERRAALRHGVDLLRDPLANKGTAFTARERDMLGLRGLLPPHVSTMEEQVARVLENLRRLPTPLDRHIALNALHDRNETLFFRVVADNPDEMMPLIYTPTVGEACQRYGHIFREARGLYVTAQDRGRVAEILRNWPNPEVAIIVVTDGERILGLGDLGANGMGIPVGKLSLYTACAGIAPQKCLPVTIDVGTNNEQLLADPLYIGLKQRRVRGEAYEALVDEFVAAAREIFPGVLIQFEDFGTKNAFDVLAKYGSRIPCFNDDIQGTAAVVLAGIVSALRISGGALWEQRLLFMGAGEAATGIADLVVRGMVREGLTPEEARGHCWLFDSKGLVVSDREDLAAHKRPYAHEHVRCRDFADAVKYLRPTGIVGVAGVGGTFTPEVLEAMATYNRRPIVFALSNPTSQAECTAEEAYRGTHGRALFACGSPFEPVTFEGRTFVPRQGNNSYVFPGIGLGAIACGTRQVTEDMFLAAAGALAERVTPEDLAQGSLYPALARVREVSARIAVEVAKVAYAERLAQVPRPDDLEAFVRQAMYEPRYPDYAADVR